MTSVESIDDIRAANAELQRLAEVKARIEAKKAAERAAEAERDKVRQDERAREDLLHHARYLLRTYGPKTDDEALLVMLRWGQELRWQGDRSNATWLMWNKRAIAAARIPPESVCPGCADVQSRDEHEAWEAHKARFDTSVFTCVRCAKDFYPYKAPVAEELEEDEDEPEDKIEDDALGLEAFVPDTAPDATQVKYLVDTLLPKASVCMFCSPPECLKSWMALRIAVDVSQGQAVLGQFDVSEAVRAAFLDFENGGDEIRRRLTILGGDGRVRHVSHPDYRINDDAFWKALEKFKPGFVVIDGLGSGQEGVDEKTNSFADPLTKAAKFANQFGTTFLLLHHPTKAATVNDVESLFRGTGAIRAKVDSAYYFNLLEKDEATGTVTAEVLPIGKCRKGQPAKAFTIELTNSGLRIVKGGGKPAGKTKSKPKTNADKVYDIVATDPGISGRDIWEESGLGRNEVYELLDKLEADGRIRREGKGRSAGYYPA